MDHEGPKSKINSEKRATAAEQVAKLHDEYEARGKPRSDKILPVLTHNETYPKLRKQIDNRRSVADVSDVGKARTVHSSRPTNRADQRTRGKRYKNFSRVTKKRSHNCSRLPTKIFTTKSCQFSNHVSLKNRRVGTEAVAMASATVAPTVVESETIIEFEPSKGTKPPGSKTSSIGSHITSVSSLNSCYSIDQEPMDRKSL